MRSISHAGIRVWVWLGSFLYGLPTVGRQRFQVWQGATIGWSPKKSTKDTGGAAGWDVQGWLEESARETREAFNRMERELRAGLIEVREQAYEWRDTECLSLS